MLKSKRKKSDNPQSPSKMALSSDYDHDQGINEDGKSWGPYEAGAFFSKIECFCFTEQVLMPGERVDMPVTFFVDPEMIEDRDAKYIKEITLSYTFYEIDLPEDIAELTTGVNSVEPILNTSTNEG